MVLLAIWHDFGLEQEHTSWGRKSGNEIKALGLCVFAVPHYEQCMNGMPGNKIAINVSRPSLPRNLIHISAFSKQSWVGIHVESQSLLANEIGSDVSAVILRHRSRLTLR